MITLVNSSKVHRPMIDVNKFHVSK